MTLTIIPGRCRECGCTEDNACRLGDGDTCCWYDQNRTVCSAPACIRQYEAKRAAARAAAKPTSLTSAQVSDAIRRGNRKRKGCAA